MTDSEMPTLPSALIPYQTFRARLNELEMTPITEHPGGSDRAQWQGDGLTLVVRHSGYGGGFGGRRPVRVEDYYTVGGSKLPAEQQRIVQKVLCTLTAPAPAVQRYQPFALQHTLMSFWEEVGCARFRVVYAPAALIDMLRTENTPEGRLQAYARIANELGAELRVARSGKGPPATWPVLFAGDPKRLDSKLDDVVAAIGTSRYLVSASSELRVEDPLPVSVESARAVAQQIADRVERGGAAWIQVDAVEPETLTLSEDHGIAALKSALEQLIATSQAKEYVVEAGNREVVKQRKLKKLATRLRSQLQEGQVIRVRPQQEPRPGAQLEL